MITRLAAAILALSLAGCITGTISYEDPETGLRANVNITPEK